MAATKTDEWREWRENVARAAHERALTLLREWLPDGKQEGREYRVGSLSGTPGRSLAVWLDKGNWKDFGSEDKGGDLISLYARLYHNDLEPKAAYRTAKEALAEKFGIPKPELKKAPRWQPITPIPDHAPKTATGLPDLGFSLPGDLVAIWTYYNAEGLELYYRARLDTHAGKQFRPISYCRNLDTGEVGWQLVDLPTPRPLYGLELLDAAPKWPVVICEGEKATEAARKLFPNWIAVGFAGVGAVGKLDLSPLLTRDSRIVLCPDNDKPGMKAAAELALLLRGKAEIIQHDKELPDKWDFADAVADGWDPARALAYLETHVVKAAEPVERLVLPANDPQAIADAFIESPEGENLYHWSDNWWHWDGMRYRMVNDKDQRAIFGKWLLKHVTLMGGKFPVPASTPHINNAIDVLSIKLNLPASVKTPTWLKGEPKKETLIATQNGILSLEDGLQLRPADPNWFNLHAVQTKYESETWCPQWEQFLAQLWGDKESRETLQEIFGYLLTSDTSQQKAFMIVGPARSGKGTIARILTHLIGADQVSNPAMAAFGHEFGLEDLVGKSMAIMSDARLDDKASTSLLAENLLRFTGEDNVLIPRKYKTAWSGRPSIRFLLLANELPRFFDTSGALPRRFIILNTTRSFLGEEDLKLEGKLTEELSGILNWALIGWLRLRERGHFIQPKASEDLVTELAEISNPLAKFIDEACHLGPDYEVSINELYRFYVDWCKRWDQKPTIVNLFGRDLRASTTALEIYKPHGQPRRYKGIAPNWDAINNNNGEQ